MTEDRVRIGFMINPIAGMGGKVSLHGTDGDLYTKARDLGAIPISRDRARLTLTSIADLRNKITLVMPEGEMGHDLVQGFGFNVEIIPLTLPVRTSSSDTKEVAKSMLASDVSLILFAGGDGTARDIHEVVGESLPLLGIPSGVKMRSGVFAISPSTAGDLVRSFVLVPTGVPIQSIEILDLVLDEPASEWPPSKFFGIARAPFSRKCLQTAKSVSSAQGDMGIDALAREIVAALDPNTLYLVGPGTTTHKILDVLGLEGCVSGVDAFMDGKIVGVDLSETEILSLLRSDRPITLYLGIIGGQGFVLGRGNQQLSAQVIDRVQPDNIVLLSTTEKVAALFPPYLYVDLDDTHVESSLAGYRQVLVAPGRSIVCRIVVPERIQPEAIAV